MPNDVANCLAASVLNKKVSDLILFSKPVILKDALRGVSQDIQIKRTLVLRPYYCLTHSSNPLLIIIHPCFTTLPVK